MPPVDTLPMSCPPIACPLYVFHSEYDDVSCRHLPVTVATSIHPLSKNVRYCSMTDGKDGFLGEVIRVIYVLFSLSRMRVQFSYLSSKPQMLVFDEHFSTLVTQRTDI